ncbi:MAG TPA: hypothetical protein VMT46_05075 [Anaerolineaceae bacterium]|nr:hypothetical protein [Anaerolineaceae bacterium]
MSSSAPALQIPQENLSATSSRTPWLMFFSRITLFLVFQVLFTLGFYLVGSRNAWEAGAAIWPLGVFIVNLIITAILVRLYKAEGKNYWDIYRIRSVDIKKDLLVLLGFLFIAGPAGFFPNILLSTWLFGDPQISLNLIMRPLPLWFVIAFCVVLFPLTQGLAELPTYFCYSMPRIQAQGFPRWMGVALAALMLSLQHLTVPFLLDIRFILWRAFMYLLFALVVGIMLNWRPRLLPYMAIVHILMDVSFGAMFLGVAY